MSGGPAMLKCRPDRADSEELASGAGPDVAGLVAGARPCEE